MLDLDNTLADRQAAVAAWVSEFSLEYGLPDGAEEWILDLDSDGYSDRSEIFRAIRSRFDLEPPLNRLLVEYRRRVVQLAVPTAGAVDCLVAMRSRDWTLALVTNGSSGQQHAKIDALGFRDLVDAVCVSGDLGVKKPSPEIFELAAEQAGASLDGAWMVGDSPTNDVDGVRNLGLKTAWVSRGRRWPDDLPPPTISISSLESLVDSIDQNRLTIQTDIASTH